MIKNARKVNFSGKTLVCSALLFMVGLIAIANEWEGWSFEPRVLTEEELNAGDPGYRSCMNEYVQL